MILPIAVAIASQGEYVVSNASYLIQDYFRHIEESVDKPMNGQVILSYDAFKELYVKISKLDRSSRRITRNYNEEGCLPFTEVTEKIREVFPFRFVFYHEGGRKKAVLTSGANVLYDGVVGTSSQPRLNLISEVTSEMNYIKPFMMNNVVMIEIVTQFLSYGLIGEYI